MQQIVIAKFSYRNPKNGEEFSVQRGWPCIDHADAELTVKYHGRKTGALEAQCNIEEITDEVIKSSKTTTVAKETHQTQPIA